LTQNEKTGYKVRTMNPFLFLLLAAFLEVGGDASVRWGLKSGEVVGFVLGGVVLFAYSLLVNQPRWDFSQSLGIYIVLFFIISQAMGVLFFGETLPMGRIVGGALVAAGGICMMVWK
jgi:multidrug transporter EmrE-like cation transporter